MRRRQCQHAGAETGVAVPRVPLDLSLARVHHSFVQGMAQMFTIRLFKMTMTKSLGNKQLLNYKMKGTKRPIAISHATGRRGRQQLRRDLRGPRGQDRCAAGRLRAAHRPRLSRRLRRLPLSGQQPAEAQRRLPAPRTR